MRFKQQKVIAHVSERPKTGVSILTVALCKTALKIKEDSDQCFKIVECRSKFLPYSNYHYYKETAVSDTAEWNHNKKERIIFDTVLALQFQARDLAENYRSMLGKPPEIADDPPIGVKQIGALFLNPCDKFYLTYVLVDEDGNEIEIYDDEVFRVLTIDKDLNAGICSIRAIKDDTDFFWTVGA